jgi:hypothetical protein
MYGPGLATTNNATYACRGSNNLDKSNPARCTGNSISAKNLHKLTELLVQGIASDPRWPAAMEAAYADAHIQASTTGIDPSEEIARLAAEMADLRKEKGSAKSQTRRAQIDNDISERDTSIAALEAEVPAARSAAVTAVPLLTGWEAMSTAQRRHLLTALIERIEILPFKSSGGQRGRTFNPGRVRIELRNVGTFHITRAVDMRAGTGVNCPECGQVFVEGSALGVHRRHKHGVAGANAHPGGGGTVYECPQEDCGRKITSAGGMKRHVLSAHGPQETYPCPLGCSRVLGSTTDLASHIYMAHEREPDDTRVPCSLCGEMFRGDRGLRIHTGRVHPEAA